MLAVVAAAASLRLLAWSELAGGPMLHTERWEATDMHFFDRWGLAIADGDVLLAGGFRPAGDLLACDVHRLRGDPMRECDDEVVREIWDSWLHRASYWQDPLYAYLLGATYHFVTHDPRIVYALQAAAGVGGALLAFLIAESLAGSTTAALAGGLLAATLGTAVHFETVLLRSAFAGVGALLVVWMTLRTVASPERRGRAFATGACCGLLGLLFSGTSTYMLLAALPAWLGIARGWFGAPPTRAWPLAALALAGVLSGMSPLVARNLAVGLPPFESAVTPTPTFIMGNAVDATASSGTRYSHWQPTILAKDGWSFLPAARATIATHDSVGDWLALLLRKFLRFWHWYELPDNVNYDYFRLQTPLASRFFVPWSLVGSLALVGVVFGLGRAPAMVFPLAWTVAAAAVCTVFFNVSRLRYPAVLTLTPIAGIGLAVLLEALRRRDIRRAGSATLLASAAAFLICAPWIDVPSRIREAPFVVHNRIAAALAAEAASHGDNLDGLRILERQFLTLPPGLAARLERPGAPLSSVEAGIAKSFANVARWKATLLRSLHRDTEAAEADRQAAVFESASVESGPGA